MSVPKLNSCGSCAAATTRTLSLISSDEGCVLGSVPVGRRDNTTTSWPAAASAVDRWYTWRPRPPITTGGYSHDTIRTFIAAAFGRPVHRTSRRPDSSRRLGAAPLLVGPTPVRRRPRGWHAHADARAH